MRAPSMDVYLQWILNAWEQLPQELIMKSFKGCGLTNALDGTEDNQIHCFKSTGSMPNGFQALHETRAQNQAGEMAQLLEEIDLAEDENSEYDSDYSLDFEDS